MSHSFVLSEDERSDEEKIKKPRGLNPKKRYFESSDSDTDKERFRRCGGNKRKRKDEILKEKKILNTIAQMCKLIPFPEGLSSKKDGSGKTGAHLHETAQVENEMRYLTETVQRKEHSNEALSSEDSFLLCDDCDIEYDGACPVHGPMLLVCDEKAKVSSTDPAVDTLPKVLSLGLSGIRKAGRGVWTKEPLPKGIVFGPFRGKIIQTYDEHKETGYAWEIRKGNETHHHVDGSEKKHSNWMRFVNCPTTKERQNLEAFQYQKQIYYRTCKPVLPHAELLVWYGDSYAEHLGIDIAGMKQTAKAAEVQGQECRVCGALFNSRDAMKRHKRQHPQSDGRGRHKCSLCPYSSSDITHYKTHLLTHTGESPHSCPLCSMAFKQYGNLRLHLRTHTGERPFSCSTCGKSFSGGASLKAHERIHSGVRPYLCPTCGATFTEVGGLGRHMKTHSGQRPHQCPHCDYRALQSWSITKHISSVHTRDFPHSCCICGKGYNAPSVLQKHFKKKHKNIKIKTDDCEHSKK